MANGVQRGKENVEKFEAWQASMSDEGFKQIIYRGCLNRGEVAKACDFAKAVLKQNPEVKARLAALEEELRERGVLPEKTDQAKTAEDKPIAYDRTVSQRASDAKRLAALEAEVLQLKARLKRFEELEHVLSEMGRGDLL